MFYFEEDGHATRQRRALEKQAQLKPKQIKDDYKGHLLILTALITGLIGGFLLDAYYRSPSAKPGEILAKSEMTKKDISHLNLAKTEKAHGL
jgi:hypothetical protein